MIEYVLICLVFGAVAALAAHGKARNALGWFVMGFLLGPFALVVAILPPALKDGYTKRCTQCKGRGRIVRDACRSCNGVGAAERKAASAGAPSEGADAGPIATAVGAVGPATSSRKPSRGMSSQSGRLSIS